MKSGKSQTIQDYTETLQGVAFGPERSGELAGEVASLVGAVEQTTRLMSFDCEPSQFQAYIGRWEGAKK